jgi:acetyl esterase
MFETYAEFAAEQARLAQPKGDQVTMPIAEARALRNAYMLALLRGSSPVRSSSDRELEGPAGRFRVRITVPLEVFGRDVILLLRGSGYWAGTLDTHDETARALAGLTGLRVCAVDYHPIPEHRAPVQLQEATLAVDALFTGDLIANTPGRLLLYGESAGANLSLSLAIQEREARTGRIGGMVLFYPAPFGMERHRDLASYQWVWVNYLGPGGGQESPHIPVNHRMGGLCPAWIGIGEADPLLPDCVDLARMMQQAGVPVELRRYPLLPHAFIGFSTQVKPAQDALRDSAEALVKFAR